MVRKKFLRTGIWLLIGGITTTPIIIGFCIAPLGLLLMAFSILQIRPTTQLTHLPEVAEARGYVKHGFDEMGRQLYGPPLTRIVKHPVQSEEQQNRE